MDENPVLAPQIDALEDFGRRVTSGLRARSELAVETAPATLETESAPGIAASAPLGALLGRTTWTLEDGAHEGCFLWIGGWPTLLGSDARSAELLTSEELSVLDQSLRLMLEEEGEGPPPVQWTSLEGVESERLPEALATFGLSGDFDTVQVRIGIGDEEMRFLFLASPPGIVLAPSAPGDAAATTRFPSEELENVAREVRRAPVRGPAEEGDRPDLHNLRHLLDVKIPLKIRLGSTRMNLEDILRITPGAILELDRREEDAFEVLANGRVIARGEVVVVDERFGLRITEIGSSSERLRIAG